MGGQTNLKSSLWPLKCLAEIKISIHASIQLYGWKQAGCAPTLIEYYSLEGRNDPIKIDIPKGHYVPVFQLIERDSLVEDLEEKKDHDSVNTIAPTSRRIFNLALGYWGHSTKLSHNSLKARRSKAFRAGLLLEQVVIPSQWA